MFECGVDAGECDDGEFAVVTTKNYPNDYNAHDNGIVTITGPASYSFTAFELELAGTGCRADYVQISGQKYCNSTSPPNSTVPSGSSLQIAFDADYSIESSGFRLAVYDATLTALGTNTTATLERCQGDCDNDDDCADGLKCYQRESSDNVPPGCEAGGSGDIWDYDYCYDPAFG